MTKWSRLSGLALWAVVGIAVIVPLGLAAQSPLLQWRGPVYHIAGYAGILGLVLMVIQPLLAGGYLAGLTLQFSRKIHRISGALLVFCVVVHVGALWVTSPPDVVDALLFVSPTSFSAWGVVAMWSVFAAAGLVFFRHRIALRLWRTVHTVLVSAAIIGTVVHVLLIEGTMNHASKVALCVLVCVAAVKVVHDMRVWAAWRRPRQ